MEFFLQICEDVQNINLRNIIYSALKPQNIFLNKEENFNENDSNINITPKIGDFGFNKKLEKNKNFTWPFCGKGVYLPLEAFEEGGKIEIKSYVWSLGCILYRFFTKEEAFTDTKNRKDGYSSLSLFNLYVIPP